MGKKGLFSKWFLFLYLEILIFSELCSKTIFKVISNELLLLEMLIFRKYGHKKRDIKIVLFLECLYLQRYKQKNIFSKWSKKTLFFSKCWYFGSMGKNDTFKVIPKKTFLLILSEAKKQVIYNDHKKTL